ncbi:hypothetical protein D3C85_1833300 [compost metagenome]
MAAAEGALDGEGAQLTVTLDTDRVLDDIAQVVEHGRPVQTAASVGQFELTGPIGYGQRPAPFTG